MYLTFVSQILNDKEKAKDIIALAKGNNNIGARNENAMKKIENAGELKAVASVTFEGGFTGTTLDNSGLVSAPLNGLTNEEIGEMAIEKGAE